MTKINVREFKFLSSPKDGQEEQPKTTSTAQPAAPTPTPEEESQGSFNNEPKSTEEIKVEDIPF